MLAGMQFLLLHSPLVTRVTWKLVGLHLEAAGYEVTLVAFDNAARPGEALYEHHLSQIKTATPDFEECSIIAVAHSGAGNLLALLDPELMAGCVFMDAIFPTVEASRFDLFDDPASVEAWRDVAARHDGVLPAAMLTRFGEQVLDSGVRQDFIAGLVDVPVELFEEPIPVHAKWPLVRRGLYVQWTDSYAADAQRAAGAGFEVRWDESAHFKMLNRPDEVARLLIDFAKTVDE